MLIEKKAGSSLKSVHPFLTPSKVDTAGRTNMGSLCSHGASNQIVVGADKGTIPISCATACHSPKNRSLRRRHGVLLG